eukprot:TRINITY_DN6885_c0_g1_i1.p1 TRINITY_DN6885_c0_g1~~TRINITY_DN6885_c0_g1_i1.p1  ORF type:complete len:1634 (+),score=331.98 TRINITY_DN6885_c0_g1_i1:690-4904(+)
MDIDSGVVDSVSISDLDHHHMGSLPVQEVPNDDGLVTQNVVPNKFLHSEQGSLSFMDDIDAENRARIQNMSPEEIAQAQAEIMGKMSPEIVEMLKRRRHKKQEQKSDKPDLDTGHQYTSVRDKTQLPQDSGAARPFEGTTTNNSSMAEAPSTGNTSNGPDNGDWASPGASDSSSWNLWTERVETVRALRFSLDGSVVDSDSIQVPMMSECSSYNVDNVTERDFLRTEGDPGAVGYTIKEAVALIRSMVPGQRALALQLLASVLEKALYNLQQCDVGCNVAAANCIDWQAIWAFALGPEPELVLSLRMSLDDNHISVILACAKVIQCILSCDVNETFFNISEKLTTYEKDTCTAPVFQSKQEINTGFLNGGFWKFSTKPSNIFPFSDENVDDEDGGKHTIQDDNTVAGQDVAAGLIRMGILPRIRYLIEMDPVEALEECLVTILIGLSRHSRACADAVMKCPRLVQTIAKRFAKKVTVEAHPSMIKSVILLKVLAQSDKKNCEYFINHRIFQDTMWHSYSYTDSIDQWIKSGRDCCKLTSWLMVEKLRFWQVCIRYGYCISHFVDFFPMICLWLSPPTFDKLIESNVLVEYASITREAYATLGALAKRLPYLHAVEQLEKQVTESSDDNMESWSWSHVVPMVEFAMKWINVKNDPYLSLIFSNQKVTINHVIQDSSLGCLLWVISAVMHMFCSIFEKIAPEDTSNLSDSYYRVPWLPKFVPKIGLEIVKNGWLKFSDASNVEQGRFPSGGQSISQDLCRFRYHNDFEASLASVCCLHGLIRLIVLADKYIQMARSESKTPYSQGVLREDKIVAEGIVMWSHDELRSVLIMFMSLVSSEWHVVQSIKVFGRGGPAPGLGLGWGASGGGFWSRNILLVQMDARLALSLLEFFPIVMEKNLLVDVDLNFSLQRINSALGACLVAGPRDKVLLEKAFDILLQDTVLKYLDFCVRHFLCRNLGFRLFRWEYKECDFLWFSKVLNSHLRKRWLTMKKKSSIKSIKKTSNKSNPGQKKTEKCETLDTIHEGIDASESTNQDSNSLVIEWAQQRLPLPMHWFLSPVSTIDCDEAARDFPIVSSQGQMCSPIGVLDIVKSGLFLLIGLEAIVSFACSDVFRSAVQSIPLVWKLHSLSMALFVKMDVLEDERSRDVYETLQELYGKHLDQTRHQGIKPLQGKDGNLLPEIGNKGCAEFLKFKTDIHESYTTFVETLIEQFSAISYGDEIYGRQVALYLHRSVEAPVRLAAWNALSGAHVLELLPPIEKCVAEAEGYLEPVEDNEGILEAYVKSWISGGLDKAALRGSMSFRLVLHHLSSFIFEIKADSKISLRKKLARSLLRDYSRKNQHKDMMLSFIRYKLSIPQESEVEDPSTLTGEIGRRFVVLSEACEGNSSLLIEVERLKSTMQNIIGLF